MNARVTDSLTVLDTSIASTNVGDEIIMDAVNDVLLSLFPNSRLARVASHEKMSAKSRSIIRASDLVIAGGSNLLSSHAALRSVWKLSPVDATLGDKFVMMGVGWYHDQGAPDPFTAWLYRSLFSRQYLHSVRDSYAASKLKQIGFTNVINTGCPTLWDLPDDLAQRIPTAKADRVVTTVNTYMRDAEADRRMLNLLAERYSRVAAWVQTPSDGPYLRSLLPGVELIAPNLAAYDRFLAQQGPLDYVGNRLHAGIRAMQHFRRTVIIEIDNRAREMGRDFSLPTAARTDFDRLVAMIEQPEPNRTRPPRAAIETWLSQWKNGHTLAARAAE